MNLPAKTPGSRSAGDLSLHDELKAALAARRELGPEAEDALIDNFIQQVERRMAARSEDAGSVAKTQRNKQGIRIATLAISLVFAIPLTAIAAYFGGLPAIVVAWVAIFLINVIDFNK